jgi:hypothetical protein
MFDSQWIVKDPRTTAEIAAVMGAQIGGVFIDHWLLSPLIVGPSRWE